MPNSLAANSVSYSLLRHSNVHRIVKQRVTREQIHPSRDFVVWLCDYQLPTLCPFQDREK
ncbi:hypothetical protein OUZ56_006869 [Daphnia magna]|uniref:Uncharacterized protein n=1 Tax=Daphnia magna TaxID=35525 RepID=A0ABQ9YWY7_9CRUS|nr:hypothetical protein OUZ56_006869 [Daphnia magna]